MTIKEPVPAQIKELRKIIQENSLANGIEAQAARFRALRALSDHWG